MSNNNQNPFMKKRWYVVILFLIIPLIGVLEKTVGLYCRIFSCEQVIDEGQIFANLPSNDRSDIYNLRLLEKSIYSNNKLKLGGARNDELIDYYVNANNFLNDTTNLTSDINILISPAGTGKSLIYRKIKSIFTKDSLKTFNKISLNELCDCGKLPCNMFEPMKQLSNRHSGFDYDFNLLPFANGETIKSLIYERIATIDSTKINIVVIDDCDELHPKAIDQLIRELFKKPSTIKHKTRYILLGRPEGFKAFLRGTHRPPFNSFEIHHINSPNYSTTGDLRLRIRDYKKYGFPDLDSNLVYDRLLNSSQAIQSFALKELSNLAGGNYLLDEFNKYDSLSIDSLKHDLYLAYIGRNSGTHCRPLQDDEVYTYLLRSVARQYLGKIDVDGYFRVNNMDKVAVTFFSNGEHKEVEVFVQDVLDFSGLIDYKPIYGGEHVDYKFHPIWLHRHLAEL